MPIAAMTTRGRITIPADVRRALGLRARDKMVFSQASRDTVVMIVEKRKKEGKAMTKGKKA